MPRLESAVQWPLWKARARGALASIWDAIDIAASPSDSDASSSSDSKKNSKLSAESADALRIKSVQGYSFFMQVLGDEPLALVIPPLVEEDDAAGVWRTLIAHYERRTTASKAHTRRMLHQTKMGEVEEYDMYKARIMQHVARLKNMGETVSDGELTYVILDGLPESFAGVRQALEVQDDVTVESIGNHLRDFQERLKYSKTTKHENETACYGSAMKNGRGGAARQMMRRGGGGGGGRRHEEIIDDEEEEEIIRGSGHDESSHRCHLCRKIGHWEQYCNKRAGGDDDCYRCGKPGHQMRYCREMKNKSEIGMFTVTGEDDIQF